MRRALLAAVVACAAIVLGATGAGAHAQLVRSEPAAGQPLGADRVVTLTFDDPVDAAGSSIAAGGVPLTGVHHAGGNPATLAGTVPSIVKGSVTIQWRAL